MCWAPGDVLRTTTRSDASHACGGRDGELDHGGGRVSATGERATRCGELGGEEEEVGCCARPMLAGTGRREWGRRRGDRGERSREQDRGKDEREREFFRDERERVVGWEWIGPAWVDGAVVDTIRPCSESLHSTTPLPELVELQFKTVEQLFPNSTAPEISWS